VGEGKPGGAVQMSEKQNCNSDRLRQAGKWAGRNVLKLNKGKCSVRPQGWSNPVRQDGQGTNREVTVLQERNWRSW